MYPTPELITYIQAQIDARVSREAIVSALRGAGWNSSAIAEAFAQISSIPTPTPPSVPIAVRSEMSENVVAQTTSDSRYANTENSPYGQPTHNIASSVGSPYQPLQQAPTIDQAQASPLIINKYSEPVVKKKKTKLVAMIIIFVILILGGLGFLYTKQKGIDLGQYIKLSTVTEKLPFLNKIFNKNNTNNLVPLSETQIIFQDAFGRLARLETLETKTSAAVTLPRSTSQTGGFINQPVTPTTPTTAVVPATTPVTPTNTTNSSVPPATSTTAIATTTPPTTSVPATTTTVTPVIPPQDTINVRIVSERDSSGPDRRLHTVVLAESSDAVELDGELQVIDGKAAVMFKKFSLVEALGLNTLLNQWIGIENAQTEIPQLSALGLPGDGIAQYLNKSSQAFPGAPTLLQELISKDIFHIDEDPESQLLDTTHVHVHTFTVATDQLGEGILAWLDREGMLPIAMRSGITNFIDSLTDISGTLTVDAESHDIMALTLNITGMIEKDVPYTITSTSQFVSGVQSMPFTMSPQRIPLSTVIQTFIQETQDIPVSTTATTNTAAVAPAPTPGPVPSTTLPR